MAFFTADNFSLFGDMNGMEDQTPGQESSLSVAIKGTKTTGEKYILVALKRSTAMAADSGGAKLLFCPFPLYFP